MQHVLDVLIEVTAKRPGKRAGRGASAFAQRQPKPRSSGSATKVARRRSLAPSSRALGFFQFPPVLDVDGHGLPWVCSGRTAAGSGEPRPIETKRIEARPAAIENDQTRRRFGRHAPLCRIGVTSRIE